MDNFLFSFYIIFFSLIVLALISFLIQEIQKSRFLDLEITRLRKKIYQEKATEKDYNNLASIYIKKKLYSQAQKEFLKILENKNLDKSQLALIYNSLGYICSAQEQYELAIEYYKKALFYIPDFILARINLARIFELKNLKTEAINMYQEVLIFDPKNQLAKRKLSIIENLIL
uniref:Uncharacterized protein ycf37 n=1 Tax=Cyanophora paradoxa TaxID=2762 RepID=YCF37_CYAPA|nr:hypothetical protein CypaCp007 [Cyanophora paradoxa]P48277.1 RecName: Full=Uncharacterized protein ycf37 [Cyanophora paradoxa]AAA81175.1 ycf37 [Cyanophora paradoxa]